MRSPSTDTRTRTAYSTHARLPASSAKVSPPRYATFRKRLVSHRRVCPASSRLRLARPAISCQPPFVSAVLIHDPDQHRQSGFGRTQHLPLPALVCQLASHLSGSAIPSLLRTLSSPRSRFLLSRIAAEQCAAPVRVRVGARFRRFDLTGAVHPVPRKRLSPRTCRSFHIARFTPHCSAWSSSPIRHYALFLDKHRHRGLKQALSPVYQGLEPSRFISHAVSPFRRQTSRRRFLSR